MKKIFALALILTFILPPTLVSANRTRGVFLSGIRADFDGVDEKAYVDTPTFNNDTTGALACWVQIDTALSANGVDVIFQMGGSDTDQATNFGQIFFATRYVSGSIDNQLEVFHRVDNSATTNRVYGDTVLAIDTVYLVGLSSSGTDWDIYVNGTAETENIISGTNTGDWFNDVGTVGTRRSVIGDGFRDGVFAGSNLDGKIDNCMVFTSEPTTAQWTALYNGGKPIHPCAIGLCSITDTFLKMGEDENGAVATFFGAIGTNNFTTVNMEDADFVRTNYY